MTDTLSEQIARDLRARLAQGLPARDLTLSGLAAEYQVSVTPVRRAVGELLAEGLLERTGRGRLALPGGAAPASATPAGDLDPMPGGERVAGLPPGPRPAVQQDIEGALAAELVQLSLQPGECFLREAATAERFGVSRTVVRQVFSRLAGRGLLGYLPRRGWRVRTLDEADMTAYLKVREVLELRALDLAIGRLEREPLERMLAGNQGDQLDNDLHGYLVERAANPYISEFFERHAAYYQSIFDAAAPGVQLTRQMAEQHRAILVALLDEDWDRARAALREHVRAQLPLVRLLLARLNSPG